MGKAGWLAGHQNWYNLTSLAFLWSTHPRRRRRRLQKKETEARQTFQQQEEETMDPDYESEHGTVGRPRMKSHLLLLSSSSSL